MSVLAALWSLRERRPRFVALSIVALGVFFAYPLVDVWLRARGFPSPFGFFDWGAFTAGVRHWQAGQPIYIEQNDSYHGSYLYPPFVLAVFWPFVEHVSFRDGVVLWGAFSVGLLWIGLQAIVAALDTDVGLHPLERLGLLWAIVGFQPLLLSLKLGQLAGFQSGLLCLACATMLRGRRTAGGYADATRARVARLASGALTAFVGLAKLPYATAGAHLLADRERFAGAVLGGVVLLGASILVFGLAYHQAYVDVLRWGVNRGATTRPPAYWLPPYYRPIQWLELPATFWPVHWPDVPTVLRYAAVGAIAAGSVLAVDADLEVFALGAVAVPLLAPVTYAYYFVPALPGVVLLLATELRREDGLPWVPVLGVVLIGLHALGLWFITQHLHKYLPAITELQPLFWAQPGLWGNLLLVGIAGARVAGAVEIPTRTSLLSPVEE